MKLKELAERLDRSRPSHDITNLIDHCDFQAFYHGHGHLNTRISSHFYEKQIISQKEVGSRLYFFDDTPVAISHQTDPKSIENFLFLSEESYLNVQQYILSLYPANGCIVIDDDWEMGEGFVLEYDHYWSSSFTKGIQISTGQPIEILDISLVEDGKMIVNDGESNRLVSIKDIQFNFPLIT